MPASIFAAICTDDPLWGTGIQSVLREAVEDIGFEVLAAPWEHWADWFRNCTRPNVLVLEWTPEVPLETIRTLMQLHPGLPVVLWGRSVPVEFAFQAAQAGVRGILRRPATLEELALCIRTVADNGTWFDNDLMSAFLSGRSINLTMRESQLVSLLAHGLKNKEIAAALGISEGTVKVYMSKLFQKLGVKDRFELALYGLKQLAPAQTGAARQPTRMLLPCQSSRSHHQP